MLFFFGILLVVVVAVAWHDLTQRRHAILRNFPVVGAESEVFKRIGLSPDEHVARRTAFKDLRYVTVPDAGHMLHHDQPEPVARLIEEFLTRGA